jgi:hypothetical protein
MDPGLTPRRQLAILRSAIARLAPEVEEAVSDPVSRYKHHSLFVVPSGLRLLLWKTNDAGELPTDASFDVNRYPSEKLLVAAVREYIRHTL